MQPLRSGKMKRNETTTNEQELRVIGERLADIRKERGRGQTDVADELGVAQSMVSRIERGEVRMHAELLAHFARLYDVTPNDILGFESGKNGASMQIPRRLQKRLATFDKLTKRDRDSLIRLMDAFLEKVNKPSATKATK